MKTKNLVQTLIICLILALMQTIFIITPPNILNLYTLTIRPLTFAILTIAIYTFIEHIPHPTPQTKLANKLALIFILMFSIVMLFLAFNIGVGHNSMVANHSVVIRNLWERGSIIILGDLIRYKLIKHANDQERRVTIFIITLTLVYSQTTEIHRIISGNMSALDAFFELIFSPLVTSIVISYFSIKGSLFLVVSVSFLYTMTPYLMPILPATTLAAFSIITSGLIFVSAIIFSALMNSSKPIIQRIREKRVAKYRKTPLNRVTMITFSCLIVIFFAGMLPIYPVVILTESMTGTFDKSSLVFVEKIPPDEVLNRINEGTVIHFTSHTNVEYIHRVVGITYDTYGKRQFITQGDAAYLVDPFPVPQSNVKGIAHSFVPYIGYPIVVLSEVNR